MGAAWFWAGVLAIADVVPLVLGAIATITLGAGFVIAGGARERLNSVGRGIAPERRLEAQIAPIATPGSIGIEMLVGFAAVLLGIIALGGQHALSVALVAMLALGAAVLLNGGTLTSRMAALIAPPAAN